MGLARTASMGAIALLALVVGAALATADESRDQAAGSVVEGVCEHVPEMDAARQALAEGDKARAVEHLRAARAMLAECERQGRTVEPRALTRPGVSI